MALAEGYQSQIGGIDYDHGFTGVGAEKNRAPHGVIIKSLADQNDKKKTIMEVFMYRARPGVYYNAHGKEVHEALAKLAGFDIERHARTRQHQLRSAAASAVIAQEEGINDGVRRHIVVEEQAGFKLVDIGLGRFWVEDEHGPLNQGTHLTKDMARIVFDACLGNVRKAPEEKPVLASGGAGGRKPTGNELGAAKAP